MSDVQDVPKVSPRPGKILKPRPGDRAKYNARQREYMRVRRAKAK